jgi:hypothetical protein
MTGISNEPCAYPTQPIATSAPMNSMKPNVQTDLAYRLSLFIGPVSAPFVFMAAGLRDFVSLQFSHLLIIVCYVFGALALSQLVLRFVFRAFGIGTACPGAPPGGGVSCAGKAE